MGLGVPKVLYAGLEGLQHLPFPEVGRAGVFGLFLMRIERGNGKKGNGAKLTRAGVQNFGHLLGDPRGPRQLKS